MKLTILSIVLLLFIPSCMVTHYHNPGEPIFIEDHDPVRIMIHPIPRYRPPIQFYQNYYWRAPMKKRTVRKYNGVQVHRKNYWSQTSKHPQPEKRKQQQVKKRRTLQDIRPEIHKPLERKLPKNIKPERRDNWRQRKSLKGR